MKGARRAPPAACRLPLLLKPWPALRVPSPCYAITVIAGVPCQRHPGGRGVRPLTCGGCIVHVRRAEPEERAHTSLLHTSQDRAVVRHPSKARAGGQRACPRVCAVRASRAGAAPGDRLGRGARCAWSGSSQHQAVPKPRGHLPTDCRRKHPWERAQRRANVALEPYQVFCVIHQLIQGKRRTVTPPQRTQRPNAPRPSATPSGRRQPVQHGARLSSLQHQFSDAAMGAASPPPAPGHHPPAGPHSVNGVRAPRATTMGARKAGVGPFAPARVAGSARLAG